jgi:hypothetical protein
MIGAVKYEFSGLLENKAGGNIKADRITMVKQRWDWFSCSRQAHIVTHLTIVLPACYRKYF